MAVCPALNMKYPVIPQILKLMRQGLGLTLG